MVKTCIQLFNCPVELNDSPQRNRLLINMSDFLSGSRPVFSRAGSYRSGRPVGRGRLLGAPGVPSPQAGACHRPGSACHLAPFVMVISCGVVRPPAPAARV